MIEFLRLLFLGMFVFGGGFLLYKKVIKEATKTPDVSCSFCEKQISYFNSSLVTKGDNIKVCCNDPCCKEAADRDGYEPMPSVYLGFINRASSM